MSPSESSMKIDIRRWKSQSLASYKHWTHRCRTIIISLGPRCVLSCNRRQPLAGVTQGWCSWSLKGNSGHCVWLLWRTMVPFPVVSLYTVEDNCIPGFWTEWHQCEENQGVRSSCSGPGTGRHGLLCPPLICTYCLPCSWAQYLSESIWVYWMTRWLWNGKSSILCKDLKVGLWVIQKPKCQQITAFLYGSHMQSAEARERARGL